MPELPEVEIVRRGLEQHVQGRTLVGPEVLHPRTARHNTTPRDVEKRLDGAVVQAVERRGKFLWLVLGDEAYERADADEGAGGDNAPSPARAGSS